MEQTIHIQLVLVGQIWPVSQTPRHIKYDTTPHPLCYIRSIHIIPTYRACVLLQGSHILKDSPIRLVSSFLSPWVTIKQSNLFLVTQGHAYNYNQAHILILDFHHLHADSQWVHMSTYAHNETKPKSTYLSFGFCLSVCTDKLESEINE